VLVVLSGATVTVYLLGRALYAEPYRQNTRSQPPSLGRIRCLHSVHW